MAASPRQRRRQVGYAFLAVAAVLLFSSVTWFSSGRAGVGIAQVAVALGLAVAGLLTVRRAAPS